MRTVGFALLLPGGLKIFSLFVRFTFSLLLTISLFEHSSNPTEILDWPTVVFSLFVEFLFGAMMSLPLYLVVDAISQWGEILDKGRGQQLGSSYGGDGIDNSQKSPFSLYLHYGILASLFSSGIAQNSAFTELVSMHYKSFAVFPSPIVKSFSGLSLLFSSQLLDMILRSINLTFYWFVPISFLYLISDIGLGFVAKLVPGLPIFAETFVLKSIVLFFLFLLIFFLQFEVVGETFLRSIGNPLVDTLFVQ